MIAFPKYIQIETSLVCSGNCVFCPHKELERGPKYMEDWVWKKIIDDSRGRGVSYRPYLVNEPFQELRMPDILRYIAQDKTARVELNSNGHFSSKLDMGELLDAGINQVRFSVDGFTQDTYTKSGRGGNLEKVKQNILDFVAERDRQKKDCFIEIRMIDIDVTKSEQKDFVKFWNEHADKGTVTTLYAWPWSGQENYHPAPCLKVREEMFFMTDGRAVLCCWDAFARGVIGDVKLRSVEEIWNGQPLLQYKNWLNKGERQRINLCSKCDAYKNYDFSNWKGY